MHRKGSSSLEPLRLTGFSAPSSISPPASPISWTPRTTLRPPLGGRRRGICLNAHVSAEVPIQTLLFLSAPGRGALPTPIPTPLFFIVPFFSFCYFPIFLLLFIPSFFFFVLFPAPFHPEPTTKAVSLREPRLLCWIQTSTRKQQPTNHRITFHTDL